MPQERARVVTPSLLNVLFYEDLEKTGQIHFFILSVIIDLAIMP